MSTEVIDNTAVTDWLGTFAKAQSEQGTGPSTPPDLDEFMKEENASDFASRYDRLQLRVADVVEYPAGHRSAEVTAEINKVTTAKTEVKNSPAKAKPAPTPAELAESL